MIGTLGFVSHELSFVWYGQTPLGCVEVTKATRECVPVKPICVHFRAPLGHMGPRKGLPPHIVELIQIANLSITGATAFSCVKVSKPAGEGVTIKTIRVHLRPTFCPKFISCNIFF